MGNEIQRQQAAEMEQQSQQAMTELKLLGQSQAVLDQFQFLSGEEQQPNGVFHLANLFPPPPPPPPPIPRAAAYRYSLQPTQPNLQESERRLYGIYRSSSP